MDSNEEVQLFSSRQHSIPSKIDPLYLKIFLKVENNILGDLILGNVHC